MKDYGSWAGTPCWCWTKKLREICRIWALKFATVDHWHIAKNWIHVLDILTVKVSKRKIGCPSRWVSWSTWSLSVWEAKPLKVGDEEPLLSALPPCKKKNRNGKGKWRKWRSRNTEAKPAQAWFWSFVALENDGNQMKESIANQLSLGDIAQ